MTTKKISRDFKIYCVQLALGAVIFGVLYTLMRNFGTRVSDALSLSAVIVGMLLIPWGYIEEHAPERNADSSMDGGGYSGDASELSTDSSYSSDSSSSNYGCSDDDNFSHQFHEINPATGLQMTEPGIEGIGGFDVGGHVWGSSD